ncbi:MAG: SAM-dependent methyltransferase [Chlamydiia bacterium]|nr:SAM-dependent methyltransferase [Chlamydiia bacterium]
MTDQAALYLFPNLLDNQCDPDAVFPAQLGEAVAEIDGLIAESEKAGRAFLSRFKTKKPAREIPIALLNEHSTKADIDFLMEPLLDEGECWGLVSDAGLPCIADPGAQLVAYARRCGVEVKAFSGPSSILLALMLSGLGGQSFTFHGYLSRQPEKREEQLRAMEHASRQQQMTQIFIEAPYRNQPALEQMVKILDPHTRLCVAWSLTAPDQGVISQSITAWRQHELPDIQKKPATFILRAGGKPLQANAKPAAKRAPKRGYHKRKPRRGSV